MQCGLSLLGVRSGAWSFPVSFWGLYRFYSLVFTKDHWRLVRNPSAHRHPVSAPHWCTWLPPLGLCCPSPGFCVPLTQNFRFLITSLLLGTVKCSCPIHFLHFVSTSWKQPLLPKGLTPLLTADTWKLAGREAFSCRSLSCFQASAVGRVMRDIFV